MKRANIIHKEKKTIGELDVVMITLFTAFFSNITSMFFRLLFG